MSSKFMCALKSKVFTSNDLRIVLFVLTVGMFILGSPSDGGNLGG